MITLIPQAQSSEFNLMRKLKNVPWRDNCAWGVKVDDKFGMLVTKIRYRWQLLDGWCPMLISRDKECWWPKWLKPLSTSHKCHQQISSLTSVSFRSSLNFFEIGNMVKIYLCKCVSIDQKYSATFNLITMCCQSIFSSQIHIPIDLIFKGKTPRKDSK